MKRNIEITGKPILFTVRGEKLNPPVEVLESLVSARLSGRETAIKRTIGYAISIDDLVVDQPDSSMAEWLSENGVTEVFIPATDCEG